MPPQHEAWLVAAAYTVLKEAKPSLLYGINADPTKMTHSRIAFASHGPSFLKPRR